MLVSALVAMLNAVWIQGFAFHDVVKSAVDGFNVAMLPNKDVSPLLSNLLNRGGMNSMMSTLLICFCALSLPAPWRSAGHWR